MAECNELAAWAESLPLVPAGRVTNAALTKNLQMIEATLPTKQVDDAAGEKRTAVYLSILGGYSLDAIKFLTDRACRTLKWFPTPSECLAILADYRAPESERSEVLRLCATFSERAFEQWLANVRDGQPIGDVPERWLRIAECQDVLRRLSDGSYELRTKAA